jgi:hypothetical protein
MQKWLKDKKNPFDGKMNKTELMNFYVGKVMMFCASPHTIVNLTQYCGSILFST